MSDAKEIAENYQLGAWSVIDDDGPANVMQLARAVLEMASQIAIHEDIHACHQDMRDGYAQMKAERDTARAEGERLRGALLADAVPSVEVLAAWLWSDTGPRWDTHGDAVMVEKFRESSKSLVAYKSAGIAKRLHEWLTARAALGGEGDE